MKTAATNHSHSYIEQGLAAQQQARYQDAIQHYNHALSLDATSPAAYYYRGMAHYWLQMYAEMASDFTRAIQYDPKNVDMLQQIAVVYVRQYEFVNAMQLLQNIIELNPNAEKAWTTLASTHFRIGNIETAHKMFAHIIEKFPNNVTAKLEHACMLPHIPLSQSEIDRSREQFVANLDQLLQQKFRLNTPEKEVLNLPFYHAYHGRNNVDLAKKLSAFYYASCKELDFTAPHCKEPKAAQKKIRIGFVSEFLHNNMLNQFWLTLMEQLGNDPAFEVYIFSNTHTTHPAAQSLIKHIHRYVVISSNLKKTREQIAAEQIDILLYLEIGMAQQSYFLAHARLAPVQCVMGGHPVTTGIPTVDYYFSARNLEPENAQAHYSEKLIMFDRPINIVKRPTLPATWLTREALGLPAEGAATLYCCPVMLFKLHPDMDKIFAQILSRDPKAIIVLFNSAYTTLWRASLEKRFAAHMPPELCSRIAFLPHASPDKFLHILHASDALLDSVHFAFGTTSYICLGAHLPYVTWRGEFARGRGGAAFYEQIGITDLIADTHEQYAEFAIKLANDKTFYAQIAEKIRAHNSVLFDDVDVVNLMTDKLRLLYESH